MKNKEYCFVRQPQKLTLKLFKILHIKFLVAAEERKAGGGGVLWWAGLGGMAPVEVSSGTSKMQYFETQQ